MNFYAWMDENGNWRVTRFPPPADKAGGSVLMIATTEECMFINYIEKTEITVEVSVS